MIRTAQTLSCCALICFLAHTAAADSASFDRTEALSISQGAIGNQLEDERFYTTEGTRRTITEYRGKPLVISLIFTSCHHICPTTTRQLATVVDKARQALGAESFNVITVGFDTRRDTADAMRSFARQQGIDRSGWDFLATDQPTIESLSKALGFQYMPSAAGFDHLIQTSIVDANGVLFRQVYGMQIETPHLIEPLKVLVFGDDPSKPLVDQITSKVRLFCTVYDPATDTYKFDYSIFVGLFIGLAFGVLFTVILVREWRYSRSKTPIDTARDPV